MSDYGIQVIDQNGMMIEISDRPVMVLDLVTVPYGSNGSKHFNLPVSGVAVDCDYNLEPSRDGKVIKVICHDQHISWRWESAKAILASDAKIIVLSGAKE